MVLRNLLQDLSMMEQYNTKILVHCIAGWCIKPLYLVQKQYGIYCYQVGIFLPIVHLANLHLTLL
jgi:hypothetical protein